VDGIFAADMPAIAFLKAALAIGKKIPDDLAIVAYDGTYITNASTTRLTSIHQPYKEIAPGGSTPAYGDDRRTGGGR